MYHFSNVSIAFAVLENLGMENRIDSISVRSEVMTKYLIPQKIVEAHLERSLKWVLHPYFFSGNISKMISEGLPNKMIPLMMNPEGRGAR